MSRDKSQVESSTAKQNAGSLPAEQQDLQLLQGVHIS